MQLDLARQRRTKLTNSVYVVVEMYKIAAGYSALRQRTIQLRHTKPKVDVEAAEGYELQDERATGEGAVDKTVDVGADAADTLKNDWEDWALNAAVYA